MNDSAPSEGLPRPAVAIGFAEFVALAAAMQSTQALAIDGALLGELLGQRVPGLTDVLLAGVGVHPDVLVVVATLEVLMEQEKPWKIFPSKTHEFIC